MRQADWLVEFQPLTKLGVVSPYHIQLQLPLILHKDANDVFISLTTIKFFFNQYGVAKNLVKLFCSLKLYSCKT